MATYWFAGNLYQDAQLSIASDHPALAYGASVFTTMRVYENSLEHPLTSWRWHCDRISQSLNAFHWPQPDWQRIAQGCQTLMTSYPVLRLAILADGRELITGRPLPKNLNQQQAAGVTVWVAPAPQYQRSLPGHKTGNYLPCWLAMQTAKTYGARDAILATAAGEWLETSTGNLWGYQDGRWWTPPLESGLLPGIRRAQLLKTLQKQVITDRPWTVDLAKTFECLAYSNCVVGMMPIHTVLLGNIKLNYSSTHEGLSALRQMFDGSSLCEHNC
ncbi:aminotransferase class IV [Leptolyngbya cf. ectocarpi LEGE 11479]|uniref:Aminotransferase class IV n=1 Tax=Leptolyngbya cf. ectocarpi LEGE 11479 TaxID=1828722 RepID=A0A928X4K5_LEPEC|nr:aminotransferase class IV [Leptolyngbya ectocarpi]MBE9067098.1 aminotransferase class IV [Leptolyngbya cf. ectocarpi LEGE 11479]